MKRILPYPAFAVALLAMWLLLTGSASPGHVLLGTVIAVLATKAMAALQPEPVKIRLSSAIPKLAFSVFQDIIRSNLAVARIILFGRGQDRRSGFLQLPLDLRDKHGLAVLACIITATPGTLWVKYDRAHNLLLIHVLDLVDDKTWIDLIKNRYERLLMEIFD